MIDEKYYTKYGIKFNHYEYSILGKNSNISLKSECCVKMTGDRYYIK